MLITLLGFPRSGTTLYQSLLTQNKNVVTKVEENRIGRALVYNAEELDLAKAVADVMVESLKHDKWFIEKDTLILEQLDRLIDNDYLLEVPCILIQRNGRDCIASYWGRLIKPLGLDAAIPFSKVVERYNRARANTRKYEWYFDYTIHYEDLIKNPKQSVLDTYKALAISYVEDDKGRDKSLHGGNVYMQDIEKPINSTRAIGDSFAKYLTPSEQRFVEQYADLS